MSMENARAFYEKVQKDPGLQKEIVRLTQENPAKADVAVVKLAGQKGFQFNTQEMQSFFKELAGAKKSGELNDSELEAVAGGKGPVTFDSVMAMGINC